MKPPSTGVRTLRHPPHRPTPLDRTSCYPFLSPSPVATSSRVQLPPTPPAAPLASFRRFHTSPPLHSPPHSPGSGSVSSLTSGNVKFEGTDKLSKSARSVHSSASNNAQPLEKDFTIMDDGIWDEGRDDHMPFTPEDWKRHDREQAEHQLKHFTPPPVPSPRGNAKVDYQPTDDDLLSAAEVASQRGEIYSEDFDGPMDLDFQDQMPDTFDLWEEDLGLAQPKRKARRRRISVEDLPVLQPGEELEEGEERYDWRTRARSQRYLTRDGREVKRVENGIWYPEGAVRTERHKGMKLEPEQQFYEEVTRYEEHFTPLLMAEHDEELRAHAERQSEWSDEKLKEEGYMLERLGATPHSARNQEAYIYTFAYTGKEAAQNAGNLKYHIFKPGTSTEICRTHPHHDYVTLDGTVNEPSYDAGTDSVVAAARASIEKLKGSVYSVTQKYIRVAFETEIVGIEQGHWRLDVGCNDIALRRQLEAISYLHFDPQHLQRQDAQRAALEQSRSPRVRRSNGDEDSAFNQISGGWPVRRHQTVLQGTNLRDKILRAFQQEYIPHDPTVSLRLSDSARETLKPTVIKDDLTDVSPVVVGHETEPGDVDATPIPIPVQTGSAGIFAKNQMIVSWAKRHRVDKGSGPIQIENDDPPLTPTQMRAIAMMLSERLSLVQGPPGTGKTRVIIETIKLLKKRWQIPHPILVTAHTNAAVDNLLSGLREHGIKAARLGREEVVREDLRGYTTARLMESHPLFPQLDALMTERDAQQAELKAAQAWQSKPAIIKKKQITQGNLYAIRKAIERDILLDADVICTTCLSAASKRLDDIDFPMVFLDEASMATEPLSLVPLMKGSSHVAIIGDHKQLPPVIKSELAQLGGLGTSMFERLIHEHDIPSIMLDTQYRMHPQIAAFPNRAFYGSALTNGTVDKDGQIVPGFIPPETEFLLKNEKGKRQNVTFVHHESMEDTSSKSIRNEGEAGRVCDVVADLLYQNPNLKGKDIGIITPYIAQIRQITDYLRFHEERQMAFLDLLGEERVKELLDIEIRTVDGFEGREKAVIVFSTVRNNSSGYIGFLADWRRLNVGLTRAKRALIVIGSADHLARARLGKKAMERLPAGGAKVWREFMAWLEKEDLILRAE